VSPDLFEGLDPNERFRARRAQARRRRHFRRLAALIVGVLLVIVAAGLAVGAKTIGSSKRGTAANAAPAQGAEQKQPARPRALPSEVRGVHVTMALASVKGQIDTYLKIPGLNTLEVDVKDENGEIGFLLPATSLARKIGASKPYYKAGRLAEKTRASGVYLIGRVVVFEDPMLSEARPELAIKHADGSVWRNDAGLGWVNPYLKRVWDYNVEVASAAARAGFDEIQFDYVRFPSDGDVENAVYRRKTAEAPGWTIARFVHYAATRLRTLGVRVSVDVFGLSATRDLGIGQVPRRLSKYVDAVYPMVYPSHYRAGEYNLPSPSDAPGLTVANSLRDFNRVMRGSKAKLIPWLEDFSLGSSPRTPGEVRAQIAAARRAGSKGFLLWNPSGIYTQEVLSGT
jgi:hypothetical protein